MPAAVAKSPCACLPASADLNLCSIQKTAGRTLQDRRLLIFKNQRTLVSPTLTVVVAQKPPTLRNGPAPFVARGFPMTMRAFLSGHAQASRYQSPANADDLFTDTRMPFGDHLEELRWRLWRAIAGFAVVIFLVFTLDFIGFATGTPVGVAKPLKDFIASPVEQELTRFYRRRVEKVLA